MNFGILNQSKICRVIGTSFLSTIILVGCDQNPTPPINPVKTGVIQPNTWTPGVVPPMAGSQYIPDPAHPGSSPSPSARAHQSTPLNTGTTQTNTRSAQAHTHQGSSTANPFDHRFAGTSTAPGQFSPQCSGPIKTAHHLVDQFELDTKNAQYFPVFVNPNSFNYSEFRAFVADFKGRYQASSDFVGQNFQQLLIAAPCYDGHRPLWPQRLNTLVSIAQLNQLADYSLLVAERLHELYRDTGLWNLHFQPQQARCDHFNCFDFRQFQHAHVQAPVGHIWHHLQRTQEYLIRLQTQIYLASLNQQQGAFPQPYSGLLHFLMRQRMILQSLMSRIPRTGWEDFMEFVNQMRGNPSSGHPTGNSGRPARSGTPAHSGSGTESHTQNTDSGAAGRAGTPPETSESSDHSDSDHGSSGQVPHTEAELKFRFIELANKLGCSPQLDASSSDEDLKKAYRKLALRMHPDKNPTSEQVEQFKELTAAWTDFQNAKPAR